VSPAEDALTADWIELNPHDASPQTVLVAADAPGLAISRNTAATATAIGGRGIPANHRHIRSEA
jgi:hypothetical protein